MSLHLYTSRLSLCVFLFLRSCQTKEIAKNVTVIVIVIFLLPFELYFWFTLKLNVLCFEKMHTVIPRFEITECY